MQRIKELDGLRVIAIFAVLLVHFRPTPKHVFDLTSLGWAGVDLFFAISGFLITGILIRLRTEKHPFKTFYWRRVLRIFPPYYLALAGIVILALLHDEIVSRLDAFESATFLSSLDLGYSFSLIWSRLFADAGFTVAAAPVASPHFRLFIHGIGVFWSLSVEESFYLLWAPVILKGSRRTIFLFCVVPLVVCPAFRALMHTTSYPETFSFFCRFDALAAGGCVALLFAAVNQGRLSDRTLKRVLLMGISASGLALLSLSWRCGLFRGIELRTTVLFSVFGYTLLAILFATLTGACAQWSGNIWLAALRWRPIVYIGTISYTIYLIHIPAYVGVGILLRRQWTYQTQLLQGTIAILLTIALAGLSWRYFESPILRFRDRPFALFSGSVRELNTHAEQIPIGDCGACVSHYEKSEREGYSFWHRNQQFHLPKTLRSKERSRKSLLRSS